MARSGPRRVHKYELEFKLRAVQLTEQPGVLVRDVVASLSIHPFMLSRWRKQVADGDLVGQVPELDLGSVAELQRLDDTERRYKRLLMEHDLLKRRSGLPEIKSDCFRPHPGKPGNVPRQGDVHPLWGHPRRLLCVAIPRRKRALTSG